MVAIFFGSSKGRSIIASRWSGRLLRPGQDLVVRVQFHGVPLANARLEAFSRDGSDVRAAEYLTDAGGRIRVRIDRSGVWLLRMVHMIRCEKCDDADWESFWASYTFATANASGGSIRAPDMFPAAKMSRTKTAVISGALGIFTTILGAYFLRRRARRTRSTAA